VGVQEESEVCMMDSGVENVAVGGVTIRGGGGGIAGIKADFEAGGSILLGDCADDGASP
jgi:hypothetical protein